MNVKRLTAALCAGLMLLGLAGCGGSNEADTAAVHAALDKLAACTSVTTNQLTTRNEALTVEGETFLYSGTTEMELSLIVSPEIRVKATTIINISYADNSTSQTTTSYIVPENGGYTEYYNDGSGWYTVSTGEGYGELTLSVTDSTALYLSDGMTFRKAGTDDLDSGKAIRYDSKLEGEQLVARLTADGFLANIATMSENQQQKIRENLAKDLDALIVSIWVDEATGYPVQFKLDMTDTLAELNDSISKTLGNKESGSTWVAQEYSMFMTVSDFNAVGEIAPPPEAADAIPYDTQVSEG